MLPKSQRLSTKQFNEVLEKGHVTHISLFLIRTLGGFKDKRVAAVVPKKVGKTAVARHRGARRIYEAIQAVFELFPAGTHSIVFAKKSVVEVPFEVLRSDLSSAEIRSPQSKSNARQK